MKAVDLYRLMEHLGQLTEETLPQLKLIVEEFPYFQLAVLLYLKNLAVLNDIRLGAELKKLAVFVPDRRKLFLLVEGERYGLSALRAEEPEQAGQSGSFSLIDAFLSEHERKTGGEKSPLLQPSAPSDYLYWSFGGTSGENDGTQSVPLQHQELIDSFVENESRRKRADGLMQPETGSSAPETPDGPDAGEDPHKPLDDSYLTETLARIYIKQKRYEKALLIIKKLDLQNPGKNIYFADQIRFLEKLIINTKK